MISVALLAAAVLSLVSFCFRRKRLHGLALAFGWLVALFIKDALFVVAFLNMRIVEIPASTGAMALRIVNIYILTPVIVMWGVDASAVAAGALRKLWAWAAAAAALVAFDAAFVAAGAWKPVQGWSLALSAGESALVYAAAALATAAFARAMRKDGIPA
ncbi:hypothetical protein [Paenibacillus sp.]|uniref:hypothetical protein n=1 Tax=Paenibacillus sp. TaxID=58172 RepID=UPI002D56BE4F|nr:hypothetical protein [Paenibacillus sp.]HZG57912.1 hypothetical protein [Paenibacillus sp.]